MNISPQNVICCPAQLEFQMLVASWQLLDKGQGPYLELGRNRPGFYFCCSVAIQTYVMSDVKYFLMIFYPQR